MAPPRVAFVGNCQAQAFEALTAHLGFELDVIRMPPVFVLSDLDRVDIEQKLDNCDFIFKQRVDDNYNLEYLRDQHIRSDYPNKVILWPNIYFDGYFPGIRYLYKEDKKVEGPLIDYHFDWVIESWRANASVTNAAKLATDPSRWLGSPHVVERSLEQLRRREHGLDVIISDYVRDRFRSRKLFYSMNHPITEVLAEMLRRLMRKVGLPDRGGDPESFPYHLDQIDIPCLAIFRALYSPIFHIEDKIKGSTVSQETNLALADTAKSYDWPELVSEYYRLYDRVEIEARQTGNRVE
jgi:hypothetical protein